MALESYSESPDRPEAVALTSRRDRLLNVREVAAWLSISPAWVRDHASGRRRPYMPAIKLGKALRFRAADVERFIDECRLMAESRGAGVWQAQPTYRRAA